MNPFLKLAAEKKDQRNSAARKIFSPFDFVTALECLKKIMRNAFIVKFPILEILFLKIFNDD